MPVVIKTFFLFISFLLYAPEQPRAFIKRTCLFISNSFLLPSGTGFYQRKLIAKNFAELGHRLFYDSPEGVAPIEEGEYLRWLKDLSNALKTIKDAHAPHFSRVGEIHITSPNQTVQTLYEAETEKINLYIPISFSTERLIPEITTILRETESDILANRNREAVFYSPSTIGIQLLSYRP